MRPGGSECKVFKRDLKGKWHVWGAWPDWEIWAGRPGGSECEVFKRDLKGKWEVWGARPELGNLGLEARRLRIKGF